MGHHGLVQGERGEMHTTSQTRKSRLSAFAAGEAVLGRKGFGIINKISCTSTAGRQATHPLSPFRAAGVVVMAAALVMS